MCGIFGFSLNRPIGEADLLLGRRATESLKHRGPDGGGEWADAARGLYLGHRRLAVIDTSAANAQPMTSGALTVSFNGEIYNFKELRDELAGRGHAFATAGDTEVLLKAWQEWGAGALDRFDGMFAIALYDGARLHLVTDPFGEKPLFCAVLPDGVYFASEVRGLTSLLGLDFTPTRHEIAAFMCLGFIPAAGTGFRDLIALPPATHAVVEGGRILSQRRYWTPPRAEPHRGPLRPLSERDLDRIHEDLLVSTKRRVRSDVPVGLFLSAGVDSATVAAIVAKDLKLGLEAFTVSFPDAADESAGAARIAGFLGLPHRIVDSREQAPIELGELFGIPHDNLTAISVYQMSALARPQMTVALSGIGGDELFYGYNKYSFLYGRRNLYRFLPPVLRWLRPLDPLFGYSASYRRARSLLRGDMAWRFVAAKNSGAGDLLARIPKAQDWANTLAFDGRTDLAFQARDFDMRETLPGNYYPAIDRGSMRASLEVRTPFLSRRLAETLAGFDQRAFLAFGQKSVLRRILYRYVPREAMQELKQGFVFPAKRYLAARPDVIPNVQGIPNDICAEIWRNRADPACGMLAVRLCVLEAFAKKNADTGEPPQPARAAV